MKRLAMVAALLGAAFATPAFAGTCDESTHVVATSALAAEMQRAGEAISFAAQHAASHSADAKGWPCRAAQVSPKVAMRAAADAIANKARSANGSSEHDCECEDCENGLCTEANHSKASKKPCADCVDAARIA